MRKCLSSSDRDAWLQCKISSLIVRLRATNIRPRYLRGSERGCSPSPDDCECYDTKRTRIPLGSLKRQLAGTACSLHDAHILKKAPPHGKYNDAQRIAYTGVILMGIASTLTGLAIYKPMQLSWLTWLLGGYEWARWEHFWLMVMFVLFFAVNVIQVILAGWSNFRSMITGYEFVDAAEPAPDPTASAAEEVAA